MAVMCCNGQQCVYNDSFTIVSKRFPSSNGCYKANRFDHQLEPVFSSIDSGSGKNVVMLNEGQYYLFFYGFDSTTTICAANIFEMGLDHHPVEISEGGKGWSVCNPSHGKTEFDIKDDDIIVTCGCDYEDFEAYTGIGDDLEEVYTRTGNELEDDDYYYDYDSDYYSGVDENDVMVKV